MNDIEKLINSILKHEYGETWDKLDESVVQDKLKKTHKLYDEISVKYKNNPSAKNYNLLLTAMLSLQYWNQKQIKMFSLVEDF